MIETNIEKEVNELNITKHLLNALSIVIIGFIIIFMIYAIKIGILQDKNILIKEIKKFGVLAPILFLLLQLIQVILPIIPGGTCSIIGVLIFGPILGFIYNYIGIILGSILAYFLSKKYGLKLLKLFFKEETIQKYIKYIQNAQFKKIFIVGIFLPFLPDDLLCYMAGISKMNFFTFLKYVCIGKIFTIVMYSITINLL